MEKMDLGENPTVIADWAIDVIPKGQVAVITWACAHPNHRRPVPLHPPQVWTIGMLQRLQATLPELIGVLRETGGSGIQ